MKQGTAVFSHDGEVKFFGRDGRLVTKGNLEDGPDSGSPLFNFAVALMKHHGDWPQDLPCDRVVDLHQPVKGV